MADIDWDIKDLEKGLKTLEQRINTATNQAVLNVANEVLRLSQREVPHDTGLLQNSGNIQPNRPAEEITVGYNKVYAARLHEHPEYKFQKGRKGKYLEDPIKNNLSVFQRYYDNELGKVLS